jgi:ribosomal-protein-alanine N-acetyltransferase
MPPIIQTKRLDLVPMTPAFLHASLVGDACKAEELLSVSLPVEWPGDYVNTLSRRLRQLEVDRSLQPWLLRAMVLRGSGVAVGHIGFHTAPGPDDLRQVSPDAVEFGYTVYPAYRRQGYAGEAAVGLMRWATESHGVQSFVLSVRPDNIASQALAAKLGFCRIGSHVDEVDGVEDVLVFTVS